MKVDRNREGQLDSIVSAIISAARLDFTEMAEVGDAGDRIDAIAAGINMLVEELKESVVSKEQLSASEEKYRSLFENSQVGMFRVNINTQKPVAANRKTAELFGYGSVAELMEEFKVGEHYRIREQRDLMLHLVSLYGEVHDYELEFVRRDGTTFWGRCTGKLYADVGHVEGSIVDVTRQKLLLRQLKEAQRIANIGHWQLDIPSMKLEWSDEIIRILELDPDPGLTYESFLSIVHPEDRKSVDSAYWASVKEQSTYDIRHRLLLPDGRVKWVREKCETVYTERGTPIRSIGTMQDITDSQRMELELGLASTAINNTLSSIFIADLDGQVTYANPASAKYWGYGTVRQMMKEKPHVMDYWTDDTRGQAQAIVGELMEFGVFRGQGLVGRRKDGTTFPVEINASMVKDSAGQPVSMIGSFSDITLSKEASSRVYQALIEGQENERKRISLEIHDQLGQDLTGIKLRMHHLSGLIGSSSIPTELKDAMEGYVQASLNGLKQAIRFTSTLGSQLYPPILQEASIGDALEELVGKYRTGCHHIQFSVSVGTSIPEMDQRTRLSVYRIVQEGLTNVVRHSEASKVSVILSSTPDSLTLTISDNGVGYPNDLKKSDGLGIRGISERVHALSGTVRFTVNKGAMIQVTIPVT